MPAVFDRKYVKRLDGRNVKKGRNKRDLAEQVVADIRKFKSDHGLDRMVMVWCGSTEVYMKEGPVHQSLAAFEKGLELSDDSIPSSMIYAYAALKEGTPFANAAPNLTADIPAMLELAAQTKAPVAGNDMKTGQTLIKTVIAPGLKARMIGVHGWYSTNILGNRDGGNFLVDRIGPILAKLHPGGLSDRELELRQSGRVILGHADPEHAAAMNALDAGHVELTLKPHVLPDTACTLAPLAWRQGFALGPLRISLAGATRMRSFPSRLITALHAARYPSHSPSSIAAAPRASTKIARKTALMISPRSLPSYGPGVS